MGILFFFFIQNLLLENNLTWKIQKKIKICDQYENNM